ncbi:hypothetical protein ACU686_05030 [Yinghuangia aomiensis]
MSPADPRTVHVNSLRWFASAAGGTEFVRAHDDGLDDATVALAMNTPYPGAQHVLCALEAAGVAADCWFVVDGSSDAVPAEGASGGTANGSLTRALPPASDDAPLGGLTLVVGDDADRDGGLDRSRVAPDAAIARPDLRRPRTRRDTPHRTGTRGRVRAAGRLGRRPHRGHARPTGHDSGSGPCAVDTRPSRRRLRLTPARHRGSPHPIHPPPSATPSATAPAATLGGAADSARQTCHAGVDSAASARSRAYRRIAGAVRTTGFGASASGPSRNCLIPDSVQPRCRSTPLGTSIGGRSYGGGYTGGTGIGTSTDPGKDLAAARARPRASARSPAPPPPARPSAATTPPPGSPRTTSAATTAAADRDRARDPASPPNSAPRSGSPQ